jgi:hypothetical protein
VKVGSDKPSQFFVPPCRVLIQRIASCDSSSYHTLSREVCIVRVLISISSMSNDGSGSRNLQYAA